MSQLAGTVSAISVQGDFAYVGEGPRLVVVNISNPTSPLVVGQSDPLPFWIEEIQIIGNYAYVAAGDAGLWVIEISDPTEPIVVGFNEMPTAASDVAVVGQQAFVANGPHGLWVSDISNPAIPVEVGYCDTPDWSQGIAVSGEYAYLADGLGGLRVVSVADPQNPVEVGFYDTPGLARDVAVLGSYAYIADWDGGLRIINISDPTNPVEEGFFEELDFAQGIVIDLPYVYVADGWDGLWIIDVTEPTSPTEIAHLDSRRWTFNIVLAGDHIYAADEFDLWVVNVSNAHNPIEVGLYETTGFIINVAASGDYAYLSSRDKLWALDISTPSSPNMRGYYDSDQDIRTTVIVGTYGYVADGYGGIKIINVSDPDNMTAVSSLSLSGFISELVVEGRYLYAIGEYDGLHIVDVVDPWNPQEIGFLSIPGHAWDVAISGNYAFVAADTEGLRIIDISNPYALEEISHLDTPGYAKGVATAGNYAYVSDYHGGLRIIDTSDPYNPFEVGAYIHPRWVIVDAMVAGNIVYAANAEGGVRVVDVIDPSAPTEIGFYNTAHYAQEVVVSGIENSILVADDSGGFYILRFTGDTAPVASISYIWYPSYPNPAIQGQDTVYFNGSGHDTDEGGAYITNHRWTSSLDGLLSTQEDFSLPASELSAGTHTISFQVQDDEGEWSPVVSRSLVVESGQTDARTLILVNRQKLESLYGSSQATQVMDKLSTLALQGNADGLVVQVENNAAVAAAYAARGDDYEDKDKANAVVEAIVDQIIEPEWNAHPNLEYLVIVGDDRILPFYRTHDGTWYPDPWTLTDDYYTDRQPTPCPGCANPYLLIPDLASGRLVETPAQINAQIDTFLANDTIDLNSGVVTGYDFIQDGAQAHCQSLRADDISTDCTLIGDTWNKSNFVSKVLQTDRDVVSINAHANEYGFGTPSGEFVSVSDLINATVDFSRAIFYTVGCHAGYNVSSGLDLPEGFASMKANYVANTGFGWGGGGVILSEEIMWDFTKKLTFGAQSTPGTALMLAKQQYYADHPTPGPYDEKVTTESTLYGLPMYRVSTATAMSRTLDESIRVESTTTTLGGGLSMDSKFLSWPMPIPQSTPQGTYYTLFGAVTGEHGEPILPRLSYDVGQPGRTLHGVVFTGGSYSNVSADPAIQSVMTMSVSAPPVVSGFQSSGWFPPVFFAPNRVELESGTKETLVASAGQYNSGLSSGQQRIYTGMSFDLYYHDGSTDWDAPSITAMTSSLDTSASILVRAEDASGIEAVVVAYTDGSNTWHSARLVRDDGDWSSTFPGNDQMVFFVQIVDRAGNVFVEDNHGRYFLLGEGLSFDVYLPVVVKAP